MSGRRAKREKLAAEASSYLSVTPWNRAAAAWNGGETRQTARIRMYEKLIEMLAISRFKWKGLPSDIDERFMELTLFERGQLVWFLNEREKRWMVTYGNWSAGGMNTYLNPTSFQPIGNNFTYHRLDSKHAVPIWDNRLRCTMLDIMFLYAQRLANIDRAFDVNLDNQTVPLIIACNEQQKLSLQNAIRQKSEGVPAIFTYDTMNITETIQSFPNATPDLTSSLLQVKAQVWNEVVKFLGIENSNNEKRERLITDEVQAGSETTNVFRLSYLQSRQQACDQINRLWPEFNLGVDWSNTVSGGMMDVDGTVQNE